MTANKSPQRENIIPCDSGPSCLLGTMELVRGKQIYEYQKLNIDFEIDILVVTVGEIIFGNIFIY